MSGSIIAAAIISVSFSITIAWLWAGGIDYMKKNHPDYKGEDFLNTEKQDE
jgi:uncharacterized membrane protein (DUF441 family)